MALFIPEWTKISGRNVQVKRALNALDDSHAVRRPIRPFSCAADIFAQHPMDGSLEVIVTMADTVSLRSQAEPLFAKGRSAALPSMTRSTALTKSASSPSLGMPTALVTNSRSKKVW